MNSLCCHPDVEYSVERVHGSDYVTHDWDSAVAVAFSIACSTGEATLDVLIWSEAGAKAWGGEDAVATYRDDPDASVHERLTIRVTSQGRVP